MAILVIDFFDGTSASRFEQLLRLEQGKVSFLPGITLRHRQADIDATAEMPTIDGVWRGKLNGFSLGVSTRLLFRM